MGHTPQAEYRSLFIVSFRFFIWLQITENEEYTYKIITQYPFSACNLHEVWLQIWNVPVPQWKYFGVSSWEQITTKNALLVSFGYNYLKFQADKDDETAFRAQLCPFCQQNMIWYTGLSVWYMSNLHSWLQQHRAQYNYYLAVLLTILLLIHKELSWFVMWFIMTQKKEDWLNDLPWKV